MARAELSTAGGLVVSFVDGVSNLGLLATRTGLDLETAAQEAARLIERGFLEVVSGPGVSGSDFDPSELDEDVDLDRVRRKLVLETYHSLDRLSYYELLEVHPDADRKTIQKAYFRLSKVFHPDTLYGKNLGSYRGKMEAVFQRMTRAYEVLGRTKRRAEYDAKIGEKYLERLRSRMVAMVATEPPPRVESGSREAVRAPLDSVAPTPPASPGPGAPRGAPTPRPSVALTPPTSPRPGTPSSAPTPRPSVAPRSSLPPGSPEEVERRRRLAAARLSGAFGGARGSAPRPRPPTPAIGTPARPTPAAGAEDRRAAAEALAQSVQRSSTLTGNNPRLAAILAAASKAESDRRYEEALMHLGAAQREAPERGDITGAIKRVRKAMAASNIDQHRERAEGYFRTGRFREAAFAYRDVTLGAPDDAAAHRAAAECLRRMDQPDLKSARDHARRAIELEPTRIGAHLLLAEIYMDAGMKHNAIGALEAAEGIDAKAPEVAHLRAKLGG
jgi:tetratricopeptide (TPR) repeat protein